MGSLSVNIIGLTDQDCTCFVDDKPADFATQNVSETGFYITDPENGFGRIEEIANSTNCAQDDLYAMLIRARSKAVNDFETDLARAIRGKFGNKFNQKVNSSQNKFTGTRSATTDVVGLRFKPMNYRYASLYITGIYLCLPASGHSVAVKVHSNDGQYMSAGGTFSTVTYNVTSDANKFVQVTSGPTVASPLEIPFHNQLRPEDLEYYVTYTLPSGVNPVNNKFYCCGGKPEWMRKHLNICGIGGSDDSPVNLTQENSTANGLFITGYLGCRETKFLTDLPQIGDYDVQQLIGRTVQAKATMHLIEAVEESEKLNRHTLSETKARRRADKYKARMDVYANNLAWIVSEMPREAAHCLTCDEKENFKPYTIRA